MTQDGSGEELNIPTRVVERSSKRTGGTLFWEAFVRAGIAGALLAIFAIVSLTVERATGPAIPD